MKQYAVKEVFATLQGEGFHSGTPAVFLRFAGCNAWSGRAEDRARDLERTGAACAGWCDTDFVGGATLSLAGVVAAVLAAADEFPRRPELLVCTGGEPLLQLDPTLVLALRREGFRVAVETNGSVQVTFALGIDWLCVSPKWMGSRWVQRAGDELKLVVPAFDPAQVAKLDPAAGFAHYFVQPQDGHPDAVALALAAVRGEVAPPHPGRWRLSLQTHKALGIR